MNCYPGTYETYLAFKAFEDHLFNDVYPVVVRFRPRARCEVAQCSCVVIASRHSALKPRFRSVCQGPSGAEVSTGIRCIP